MAQYQITELDWDDWPPSHRMHIAILDGTVREVNKKTGLNTKSAVGEAGELGDYDYSLVKVNDYYLGLLQHINPMESCTVLFCSSLSNGLDGALNAFVEAFSLDKNVCVLKSFRDPDWLRV